MTIFERVDLLERQMTELTSTVELQTATITSLEETMDQLLQAEEDSGWLNLPLLNGVQSWGDSQVPQYRRIGNIVAIRGAVKNILANNTIIGKLPAGFRPARTTYFVQNTSIGMAWEAATTTRWKISNNGDIELQNISWDAEYGESKWFPIMNMFPLK